MLSQQECFWFGKKDAFSPQHCMIFLKKRNPALLEIRKSAGSFFALVAVVAQLVEPSVVVRVVVGSSPIDRPISPFLFYFRRISKKIAPPQFALFSMRFSRFFIQIGGWDIKDGMAKRKRFDSHTQPKRVA